MFNHSDFTISDGQLLVKNDRYCLNRIKSVEVVKITLRYHLFKALAFSILASCILWLFDTSDFMLDYNINLGAVVLVVIFPIAFALSCFSSRYQLKIEFDHTDEVGVQWVTIANGRSKKEFDVFVEVKNRLIQVIV
ncbi:hypothetical protein ACPV5U_02735 [Vibrio mediterranei]|uniref:hypothetical protein n=1 Tax=Vibrio mediterranei TaxID=689 RepID=UPI00148E6DAA|nr:hypothetical protein [Vibrio mediterranei]NOI25527.1 hypothetical protein [Vibrio mediterranei]